mmetsp:Transcript_10021/g.16836  ORF Transcript_10021/g.16836 Transcript_10021/m.16836 type:complete len:515 (-) Transcript_10021:1034-2578(-)
MNASPQVKRISIEGMVILKRKSVWVKRYAKIDQCLFSYKNSATDQRDKARIDMRKAKVLLGQRENSAPYIFIQENPLKPEAIRISFDSEAEFNRWLQAVQISRKTDEQLIEILKQKQQLEQYQAQQASGRSPSQASQSQIDSFQQVKGSGGPRQMTQSQQPASLDSPDKFKRSQTVPSQGSVKGSQLNPFSLALKISDSIEVQNFISKILDAKFKICSDLAAPSTFWHLCDSFDGVQMSSNRPNFSLSQSQVDGGAVDQQKFVKLFERYRLHQAQYFNQRAQLGQNLLHLSQACFVLYLFLNPTVVSEIGLASLAGQQGVLVASVMLMVAGLAVQMGGGSKVESLPLAKDLVREEALSDLLTQASFAVQCSPDEILKTLLDVYLRQRWDYDLTSATQEQDQSESGSILVKYRAPHGQSEHLEERIRFKYMVDANRFIIVEEVEDQAKAKYQRVWMLQQVLNRPYLMRVCVLAEVGKTYQKLRPQGAFGFLKSLAALKNVIQLSDRDKEMPIFIK